MSPQKIEKTLLVDGMSCQNCVKRVKKILSEDASIEKVEVDLESKRVSFYCLEDTNISALKSALKEYDFNIQE
ncbi:MAG: heavy-metal-associated domain-containing protein [Pseudomonadales bacterium]|nr:heavy-metal-associated domain-containing protein [Pseudomonadales bacterium]